jgi:hypothetical protein
MSQDQRAVADNRDYTGLGGTRHAWTHLVTRDLSVERTS